MNTKILWFLFLIFLCACSHKNSADEPPVSCDGDCQDQQDDPSHETCADLEEGCGDPDQIECDPQKGSCIAEISLFGPTVLAEGFWSNYRQICHEAGASFNEASQECECPGQAVFDSYFASCRTASLATYSPLEDCRQSEGGLEGVFSRDGVAGLNRCFDLFLFINSDPSDLFGGTFLTIRYHGDEGQDFAPWAFENFSNAQAPGFSPKMAPTSLNSEVQLFLGDPSTAWDYGLAQFLDELINTNIAPADPIDDFLVTAAITYIESKVSRIPYVLGSKAYSELDLAEDFTLPSSELPAFFKDLRHFSIAQYIGQSVSEIASAYFIEGDGIHGRFKTYSKPIVLENSLLIEEKVYSRGSVESRKYWSMDQSGRVLGGVHLSPAKLPNVYFSIEAKEGHHLDLNVHTYDRTFQSVQSHTYSRGELNTLVDESSSLAYPDDIGPGQGVVLCEHLNPSSLATSLDHIVGGPYRLDLESSQLGSYYGWQQNLSRDWTASWGGLIKSNGIPLYNQTPYYHGHAVLDIITDYYRDAYIIPGGYCFTTDYRQTLGMLKAGLFSGDYPKRKVKVVHASYASFSGEKTCNDNLAYLQEAFNGTLLIAAAGNIALESPDYCPQKVEGMEKIIVAAADDPNSDKPTLTDYSSYGESYADIAADGNYAKEGRMGTSFAAPRVTGLALEIAHAFPYMLPKDIKLSILASAFIPHTESAEGEVLFAPLAVSSGGVLRAEAAFQLAECLHSQIKVSDRYALNTITSCLARVEGDAAFAAKKVDFLKGRLDL